MLNPIEKDAINIIVTENGIDVSRPNSVYTIRATRAIAPTITNNHASHKSAINKVK